MRSTVQALAVALFICLLSAAPASAGQFVYNAPNESTIHVVNDDGTGDRVLIKAADVPGATAVSDPWVQPNGSTVVFAARTPYSVANCGFGCVGIYRWDAGQVTRISLRPVSCSGCSGLDLQPRLTRDSANVFFEHLDTQTGNTHIGSTWYEAPAQAGGAASEVDQKGRGSCTPATFVPSPSADEVAFVDCGSASGTYEIKVGNDQGQTTPIASDDDYNIENISWSPDGSHLVDTESGADKGMWVYPRVPNGTALETAALDYSSGVSQYDIATTWVGNDKIAFTYGGQIRTLAASCNPCDVSTASVVRDAAGVNQLAWTAQTLPVPQPSNTSGGSQTGATSQQGGSQPATGPQGSTGSQGSAPSQAAGAALTLQPRKLKLKSALKGLTVPFTSTGAGRLTLQAQLDAKTAKKLKLIKKGTKRVTVASGSSALPGAGPGTVKLKFTRTARGRLKKAKSLKLTLAGSFKPAAGGAAEPLSGSVTLGR